MNSASESESEDLQDAGFVTTSTGVHASRVSAKFMTWCPTIDTLVFSYISDSSKDDNHDETLTGLTLHRLSGQQVWSTNSTSLSNSNAKTNQSSVQPLAAAWNETGRMLALTQRDGSCRVYSSNTGKPMFIIYPGDDNISWTAISWSTYRFSNSIIQDSPFLRLSSSTSLKSLPKLTFTGLGPVLPDAKYVMRQVLEDVIHSKTAEIENFEMTIQMAGANNGQIGVSLYGTFGIGNVPLDTPDESVIDISSFADIPEVAIALTKTGHGYKLYMVHADFINTYGLYLLDLTLIPTQIDALLEYIRAEIDVVKTEIGTATASQISFYKNLLAEAEKEMKLESATFEDLTPLFIDTLLTGIPTECIEEWIAHIVKEMGIKKWKKDILHSYEMIRKKIFVYIIPALERMVTLLSQIGGLAKWLNNGGEISDDTLLYIDPATLDLAITQTSSIIRHLTGYLWSLNSEFLLYRSYSNWIEILYEEITNTPLRDTPGEGPKIAQSTKVKEYICDVIPTVGNKSSFGKVSDRQSDENSKKEEDLDTMFNSLDQTCNSVFDTLKQSMREQVYVSKSLQLSSDPTYVIKMRGVVEELPDIASRTNTPSISELSGLSLAGGENKSVIDANIKKDQDKDEKNSMYGYAAMYSDKHPEDLLFVRTSVQAPTRTEKQIGNSVQVCRVDISLDQKKTKVLQFEFIDDHDILALISNFEDDCEVVELVSMSYHDLVYQSVASLEGCVQTVANSIDKIPATIKRSRKFVRSKGGSRAGSSSSKSEKDSVEVYNEFEDLDDTEKREQMIESDFVPCAFAVNGREGRRIGCLLEEDRHRYIFFDLDGEYEEVEENEDEEMDKENME